MTDKTIEDLVFQRYMTHENAAKYYEDHGSYQDAIVHHTEYGDFQKAFNLSLRHNHYDLAKRIIATLETSVEKKRERLRELEQEREVLYYTEEGSSMGLGLAIVSYRDEIDSALKKINEFKDKMQSGVAVGD